MTVSATMMLVITSSERSHDQDPAHVRWLILSWKVERHFCDGGSSSACCPSIVTVTMRCSMRSGVASWVWDGPLRKASLPVPGTASPPLCPAGHPRQLPVLNAVMLWSGRRPDAGNGRFAPGGWTRFHRSAKRLRSRPDLTTNRAGGSHASFLERGLRRGATQQRPLPTAFASFARSCLRK